MAKRGRPPKAAVESNSSKDSVVDIVGGRKVMVGAVLVAVAVAVNQWSTLTPELVDLMKWLAAGFFLGNAAEHAAGALRTRAVSGHAIVKQNNDQFSSIVQNQEVLNQQLKTIGEQNATTQAAVGAIMKAASSSGVVSNEEPT